MICIILRVIQRFPLKETPILHSAGKRADTLAIRTKELSHSLDSELEQRGSEQLRVGIALSPIDKTVNPQLHEYVPQ